MRKLLTLLLTLILGIGLFAINNKEVKAEGNVPVESVTLKKGSDFKSAMLNGTGADKGNVKHIVFCEDEPNEQHGTSSAVSDDGNAKATYASTSQTVYIYGAKKYVFNADCSLMFDSMGTEDYNFNHKIDTSNVTNYKKMFYYNNALKILDLSDFSPLPEGETTVNEMFEYCWALKTIYVKENGFDISNATNGADVFGGPLANLKGGNGTSVSDVTKAYGRIDKPGQAGYFTDLENGPFLCDGITFTNGKWYNGDTSQAANELDETKLAIFGIEYDATNGKATLSKNLKSSGSLPTLKIASNLDLVISKDITIENSNNQRCIDLQATTNIDGQHHTLTLKAGQSEALYIKNGATITNLNGDFENNTSSNSTILSNGNITLEGDCLIELVNKSAQAGSSALRTESYNVLIVKGSIVGNSSGDKQAETSPAYKGTSGAANGKYCVNVGGEQLARYIKLTSEACVPLTFTAKQAGSTVAFNWKEEDALTVKYQTKISGTTSEWLDYTKGDAITLPSVNDSVSFKGTGITTDTSNHFTMTGKIAASGEITSLTNGVGGPATLTSKCYNYIFSGCTALTSINDLQLPSMTLETYCYQNMFQGCTGLTSIPEDLLQAPTLAEGCYQNMFNGCTGLTSIPENLLPVTTLANKCYAGMFKGCTGLTSIPEALLPAGKTTGALASQCYQAMFDGCTGLSSIPEDLLPATTIAEHCYKFMFNGCTGLSSIPANLLQASTLQTGCYGGMFSGCTKLTTLPGNLLPATTLATACYSNMFSGCTGLISIPDKLLQVLTLKDGCYYNMFKGCTSLSSIPTNLLPATTLDSSCYKGMFDGCTKLTDVPSLPATTLATDCYKEMFNGCTSLKLSSTKVDKYIMPFAALPGSGAGTAYAQDMFKGTSGTWPGSLTADGTPTLGDTYYVYVDTPVAPSECTGSACSISSQKGSGNIVAHIDSSIISEPSKVISLTCSAGQQTDPLVNGVHYVLYKGSVGVVLTKAFTDTLDEGNYTVAVNYKDGAGASKTYNINITIKGPTPPPSPTPSPSPSKKDESCEKVIGPTWHWNNSKGICEDYGVVGTSTR